MVDYLGNNSLRGKTLTVIDTRIISMYSYYQNNDVRRESAYTLLGEFNRDSSLQVGYRCIHYNSAQR